MSALKVYTIFAGVNGAGKSSFYKLLKQDFGIRINVDEIIKTDFEHDWRNNKVQVQAARIAIKKIKECLQGDNSFNQETTLTGRTIISHINQAKANGFKVYLYYVGLENVDLSIARVSQRKRKGGHGISEEDLRRRYITSFEMLKLILPLCDRVQIYDNSKEHFEFDALSPLLIVKDKIIELWTKNCPQYLKDVLCDYITALNLSE
jgi:predicted ABC-type ATPase